MDDYDTLPYQIFIHRLYALEGRYGEILIQRSKLVNGIKMSPEERKHARKFMTPAIEAYLDEKNNKANDAYARSLLQGFRNALLGGA